MQVCKPGHKAVIQLETARALSHADNASRAGKIEEKSSASSESH